jgi:Kef-type K+ transport system membrane component KefB
MEKAHLILDALAPVVLLLLFGVAAAALSKTLRLSPIVGYLALGLGLKASGVEQFAGSPIILLLAELGVVFLLFEIGLHFSLGAMREQARDIFCFGPTQVVLGAVALAGLAYLGGLSPVAALLVGATLALSSTAVVARLIADRHQQNCPVGLTATAILIFQDVAAIFLLIVVNAMNRGGAAMLPELFLAIVKAAGAFTVAFALARLVVRPLFDVIARTDNEEVFTAIALFVALAASWATGSIGLSLTLGAFLGGMIVAETPYRPIIQSETKPFRGLLLSFFFISVGLSLDLSTLARLWPAVVATTVVLLASKIATNTVASLLFRWSVPGSLQLGFLLAQGSEFAFVILSLPAMHAMIGKEVGSIIIAAVAASLALTPSVANAGRTLAGRLRARRQAREDQELVRQDLAAPVLIVGMGPIGRTVADALTEFEIKYAGIERDHQRFAEANADGYTAVFGDAADPRIWEPMAMHERSMVVLTAPRLEVSRSLTPLAARSYPNLKRYAVVADAAEREAYAATGLHPVIDRSVPRGIDIAAAILRELRIDDDAIGGWMRRQQNRALESYAADAAA